MDYSLYLMPMFSSLLISVSLLILLISFGQKYSNDDGRTSNRHIHKKGILRFGGIALILSFLFAILLDKNLVIGAPLLGVLFGSLLILFLGVVDDFKQIAWKKQLFFQFLIVIFVYIMGVHLEYVTNPFGGVLVLDAGWGYVFGFLISTIWIIFLMNAMNWVDGIDGVAGGVALIGIVAIFFLSLRPEVNQPPIGIIAAVFAGGLVAFLLFNFYPAKILAGSSGSMFIGFILAVLAIFAGAKIATTLLVLAVPIIDALWVIGERFKAGASIFSGDRRHLHFRLLELGWSQRNICLFYYVITALVAFIALNTQALEKMIALFLVTMVILVFFVIIRRKMKIKKIALLMLALVIFVFAIGYVSKRVYSFAGNRIVPVNIKNNIFYAEFVSSSQKMQKGLGGRVDMCENCGMLFEFQKSSQHTFWMKNMQFPLDILWISKNEIVYIEKNIKPDLVGILIPNSDADKVLELNAGTVDDLGIEVGDSIAFEKMRKS